jgi:hypothetical protein
MKFCEHVPNSPKIKNLEELIPNLLGKEDFLASKILGKETFSSTLNVMISQIVRNECLRFGVHVDIQVSYKILQLEILKKVIILHQPLSFQEGLF